MQMRRATWGTLLRGPITGYSMRLARPGVLKQSSLAAREYHHLSKKSKVLKLTPPSSPILKKKKNELSFAVNEERKTKKEAMHLLRVSGRIEKEWNLEFCALS